MPKLTLNRLSELVGMDRRVVAPLLDGVPYTDGPNKSHLYESTDALPAIYRKHDSPKATLAEAKTRNELAAAKLREIDAKRKLEELVPAEIARLAINEFIKYVALRLDELLRRRLIDRAWIDQCQERFNDLFADLAAQHGLEFWKATLKFEDARKLIQLSADLAHPGQPSQDPPQS